MSNGTTHDKVSAFCFGPLTLLGYLVYPEATFTTMCGYLVGFLWFSPDMDTQGTEPSKRWGPLQVLWYPYQHGLRPPWHQNIRRYRRTHNLFGIQFRKGLGYRTYELIARGHRHRGLSHMPFIGSLGRIAYFAIVVSIPAMFSFWYYSGEGDYQALWELAKQTAIAHRITLKHAYFGVELACWLHLACDYLPVIRRL